jgi:hypothetical protein
MKRLLSICLALLTCAVTSPVRAETANPAEVRQILVLLRQGPPHFRPDTDYGGSYGDTLSRGARQRIGRRIARDNKLTLVGDWPMPLLGLDCFIMTIPDNRSPEETAAHVSRDPNVAWSQPMHRYQTRGTGASYNDPLFPAEPASREWHLAQLHELSTGRGMTVAVIDTRIDSKHPDLSGQIAFNEDFVADHEAAPEQHGTSVAGIIAAKGGNGIGIVGIAPHARIMGLRACWQLPGTAGSVCNSLSLAKALHFAIEHRAQIINLSLSGPPDALIGRLIEVGLSRGATVVAAFDPTLAHGGFPASHPGVIAVADEAMPGLPPGVYSAPGRDIPTTQPGGRWYLVDGSSYAAAHVSGLIALLGERSVPARSTPLFVSASLNGGKIDAWASLSRASRPCETGCARKMAANRHP